jgi:type VI secretion system protein ImpK
MTFTNEPTVVKPRPGGLRGHLELFNQKTATSGALDTLPLQQELREEAQPSATATQPPDLRIPAFYSRRMPLVVSAAVPFLKMAHHLVTQPGNSQPEMLRQQIIAGLRDYERRLAGAQIPIEQARIAHYAICALLDDIILSTEWGPNSEFAHQSLAATFHMSVRGGERFYDLLAHLHKDPGTNRDLLYLMYLCLSLGFEGRMRISPQGALELQKVREGLYRTLRSMFGDFERELSPHWRGINAQHRPPRPSIILYTAGAAVALALALGFFGFTVALNIRSDGTLSRIASIDPKRLESHQVPPEAEKTPAESEIDVKRRTHIRTYLEPEVQAGKVTIVDQPNGALIRIVSSLFRSGSTRVAPEYEPLFNRIGTESARENYAVTVIGHTDNVPIRTVRFPSNYDLSQARADVVAEKLRRNMESRNVKAEGRADTEPLQSNDTPEGQAANRRTEILISWQGVDPQNALPSHSLPRQPARHAQR